jgi:hypothetical protein
MHVKHPIAARRWLLAAALTGVVGSSIAGCRESGYQRVAVSGLVTVDGKPLTVGSVRFIRVGGGRPSATTIGPDGRFDFGSEGVVVGRHRIEINASEQVGSSGYRWHAPQKFASYKSSGMEKEISQPTSDLALELSWEGGKPFTLQGPAAESDPKNLKARRN